MVVCLHHVVMTWTQTLWWPSFGHVADGDSLRVTKQWFGSWMTTWIRLLHSSWNLAYCNEYWVGCLDLPFQPEALIIPDSGNISCCWFIFVLVFRNALGQRELPTWSSVPPPRGSLCPMIGQCWVERSVPHPCPKPNPCINCGQLWKVSQLQSTLCGWSFCCNHKNSSPQLLFQKMLSRKPLACVSLLVYFLGNPTQYTTHTVTVTWVGEKPLFIT